LRGGMMKEDNVSYATCNGDELEKGKGDEDGGRRRRKVVAEPARL
jgi:hypothetical protein